VRCPKRIGNLGRQFQYFGKPERFARNTVLQGFAVEELHRDELLTVLLTNVINCADVRVVQCRCGLRFATKAFQSSGIVKHFWRQELQRHGSMKPRVFRFVNNAHPAAAELLDDAVMRNGLSDQRGEIRHWRLILDFIQTISQQNHVARVCTSWKSLATLTLLKAPRLKLLRIWRFELGASCIRHVLASFAFCKRRTRLHSFRTLPLSRRGTFSFSGGKGW